MSAPIGRAAQMAAASIACGAVLREERQAAGLSQTALGEALGVTFQQVQKYERGKNRISAPVLIDAADAFGIPARDLMARMADRVGRGVDQSDPMRRERKARVQLQGRLDRIAAIIEGKADDEGAPDPRDDVLNGKGALQ